LTGRPLGKRTFSIPRGRWKDNIKIDPTKVGYEDERWMKMAKDRV
jgi:hypothetical protein